MLGWGNTGTVRASASASSARGQDIYQGYVVALYRQALLNLGDSASAEYATCDAIVNESALAAMPRRGEGGTRYRLAASVFRRCHHLVAGQVRQDRRSHRRATAAL